MLTVRAFALLPVGRLAILAAGLVALGAPAAPGQEWARKMFPVTSHDFGALASGAKAEFQFVFQNLYEEDAHIASVRSSCGCTIPKFPTHDIKTWEKGEIAAVVDTRAFTGPKEATLTVAFDKPFPAEVQLHVYCVIRSDVVVQPGVVQFGSVDQGTSAQRQIVVSYAGRPDWRITNITSASDYLTAQLGDPIVNGGQITYQLTLTLSENAPAGDIQEHVTLVTNDYDARSASVPVAVEGTVVPSVTVRPSPLMLGVLAPGQSVTRYLTIKAKTPFRIVDVQSSEPAISAIVPAEAKPVHMLPVTYQAGNAPGDVSCSLKIATDIAGTPVLEVAVQARVVGAERTESAPPPAGSVHGAAHLE